MEPDFAALEWTATRAGVLLPVRVKPRGRANAVEGVRHGALLVSVTAAPAEGAANAALIEVLADFLNRARSTLSIARGHKARDKVVLAAGLDAEMMRAFSDHST
jgi:uncharacterized protein YggU (UPF0235/DUF167 family)